MDPIQGPWGLAASSGVSFPLRPSAISSALAGTNINTLADNWCNMNRSVAAPLADFPAQIHLPEVCVGGCTSDLRLPDEPDGPPGGFKEEVRKLWHHLQLACRFAPTTKNNPTIGLRFDDCNGRAPSEVIMVGHHSHNFDSRFEATCFRMAPIVEALASGQIELPSPPIPAQA